MTDLALPDDFDIMEGLQDYDPKSDAVMPTLKIDHNEGVFVDGLSGAQHPKLQVVMLGLIKQRVLWEAEVEENSKGPLCRSYEFTTGRPDVDRFPLKESGFPSIADELPCEGCKLKDWGSHPSRDTPWCSEQHTFALCQSDGEGGWTPSLVTFQRSAIKPSKTYMTSFAKDKKPMFGVITTIELDHRKRGTVKFAVPKFSAGVETDTADWPLFAENYRSIRNFVQTPRTREDGPDEDTKDVTTTGDKAPVTTPNSSASDDDDEEIPF